MSDTVTLKIKGRSGSVSELQVVELLEIDGRPYMQQDPITQIVAAINALESRLAVIESVLIQEQ